MPDSFTVAVVAHRLFGTRLVAPEDPGFRAIGGRIFGRGFLGRGAPYPRRPAAFLPVIDMDHGTRRPLDEIRALFEPDPSLAHTAGFTVNDIWAASGVRFYVAGTRDHAIESHVADFEPEDFRLFDRNAVTRRLNVAGALNVYFIRNIRMAWGLARLKGLGTRETDASYALIADRYDTEAAVGRAARFRADVITVAHEIGHVLGLRHMPELENVMFGMGTLLDSTHIYATQAAIVRHRARTYREIPFEPPEGLP